MDYLETYKNLSLIRTLDGSTESNTSHEFINPFVMAVSPGTDHVYLTLNRGKAIHKYDDEGNLIKHVQTDYYPHGIAIDSQNRILVSLYVKDKIKIYNDDLTLIGGFPVAEELWNGPLGVACDAIDNIYIADSGLHGIQVYNTKGDFVGEFGNEHLLDPVFVKITTGQDVLVTDRQRGCVSVFDLEGEHVTDFGKDFLSRPAGICLDDQGNILVADHEQKTIQVFNDEFRHSLTITDPGIDLFNDALGLAVTKSGKLFVTDRNGGRLHILGRDD